MTARVLLADPDGALLAAYRSYLRREGFEVAVARDGLDCLAKLRRFAPDVLVLDPDLPWGRGDGVLALMHEEADVRVIPVVALAARDTADGKDHIGPFPVNVYHVKPLSPDRLAEDLRRLVGSA
jgi:DNA-binding response OmpR family regulator